MEFYAAVRLAVVDEGLSHHEAGRRFGIDRRTVKKMLSYSAPPGYRRRKPVRRPKLDGFTGIVDAILEADADPDVPRKQRHTAHRISQTMGPGAAGGMDALLGRTTLAGLAANDPGSGSGVGGDELANRRLELKLGYGFSAFSDRFTSIPEMGVGLSNGARDLSLGWRMVLAQRGVDALEFGVEANRREHDNDNAEPTHAVGVRLSARW